MSLYIENSLLEVRYDIRCQKYLDLPSWRDVRADGTGRDLSFKKAVPLIKAKISPWERNGLKHARSDTAYYSSFHLHRFQRKYKTGKKKTSYRRCPL